ncbi:MAG: sodium-dependent bicarbonate transport family permease [Planctomycetota bacterium]
MALQLALDNLLSPPVLFFLVGILAVLLRSDLEIPDPIPKLFSLYLLWAIGYKGGVKLAEAGLTVEVMGPMVAAVALAALTPLWVNPILRLKFNPADAAACAAAFGSVSAVTFITAANFLDAQGIPYGGHLVAALALMEAPAVVVAVLLHRRAAQAKQRQAAADNPTAGPTAGPTAENKQSMAELLREAVLSGPVYLLIGSMVVGLLAGPRGYDKLIPFTEDVFYGMLVLFLLEAGMTAAKRIKGLAEVGGFAVTISIAVPLVNALLTWGLSYVLGLAPGDAFLLMILAASASYIAVPATMRTAIPEANAGLYLPMALGITFPFNIALGIPLYLWMANTIPQ